MVALKHGIPVFGTFVSDLYSNSYNKSLSFKAKISVRLFKYLNILTAPICKGFIANSEAVKLANAQQLYVNPFKIEVINRGRDENKFRRIPGTVNESAEVNFINVGRLVPVKGQLELIKAFSKLAVQFSEVRLSIAGEGPCRKQLEDEIENQGMNSRIKLLGSVSNLHELLPASDCFVFPSHSEGFSGSVVEAMMCGVPVLASDIAVNKEVVTHGYNGYLFESGSEQAIYESMKWFLSNREEALLCATTAIGFARENFGLNHIAGKLQDYLIEKTSTQ
jgi:glycosyltransferase involved in cell wall biosynthesis